ALAPPELGIRSVRRRKSSEENRWSRGGASWRWRRIKPLLRIAKQNKSEERRTGTPLFKVGLSDVLQHLLALFRIVLGLSFVVRQCDAESFVDAVDVVNVYAFELLGCQVLFHVLAIFRRQDHVAHSCPFRG